MTGLGGDVVEWSLMVTAAWHRGYVVHSAVLMVLRLKFEEVSMVLPMALTMVLMTVSEPGETQRLRMKAG